jgi:hypothetical protein
MVIVLAIEITGQQQKIKIQCGSISVNNLITSDIFL